MKPRNQRQTEPCCRSVHDCLHLNVHLTWSIDTRQQSVLRLKNVSFSAHIWLMSHGRTIHVKCENQMQWRSSICASLICLILVLLQWNVRISAWVTDMWNFDEHFKKYESAWERKFRKSLWNKRNTWTRRRILNYFHCKSTRMKRVWIYDVILLDILELNYLIFWSYIAWYFFS